MNSYVFISFSIVLISLSCRRIVFAETGIIAFQVFHTLEIMFKSYRNDYRF